MWYASRAVLMLAIMQSSVAAVAGDMLKPWASVVKKPSISQGYHWTYESFEYESDCIKENAYQLSKLREEKDASAARLLAGTTMKCVYQGSKNLYILRLWTARNEAVLCIAKEKKFRDYRVVLVGAPRETDDYRCE